MISCREIISLPSLAKLNIVAGKSGLDRLVRWVHFLDLPDVIPWVQGGELLIITGIGLNGDLDKLKEIVRGIIRKKLAGLIINIGPYIKETPPAVISLAEQAGFPIFELPWEVKLIEVTREISSHIVMKQTEERSIKDFLEQLLLFPLADPEVLIQRAAYYGYELIKPHQVAIVSPRRLTEFLQTQRLKDEKALVALKVRLESIVRDSLQPYGTKIMQMLLGDDVVLLLPCDRDDTGGRQNTAILKGVFAKLADEMPGLAVTAALGGKFENLPEARKSYLQAIKVLRNFAALKTAACPIYAYDQLGIYKLLFEIGADKLSLYYQEVIEPLNEYDRKQHMDLVNSLFVYFEENCNAARTAKRLFVHRNTLDYRLKKIAEITARNLDDPYDRLTLQLGVIVGRQIANDIFTYDG